MKEKGNRRWQDMDKGSTELENLIRLFDTSNRSENKSPATLRWYNQALSTLHGWLKETGRSTRLGEVDKNCVREFIVSMMEPGADGNKLKIISVNCRVRALRAFYNWLYREGYTESHLLQGVKPPRIPRVLVDTLIDKEIKSIMSSIHHSTVTGSRNKALFSLLIDTGLRLSEAVYLETENVHVDEQYLKVMGKGSKERMVAFGSATKRAILHYYIHFRGQPVNPNEEYFFLTADGYHLSLEGVKSTIKRIGRVADVPRLHAHLCRHTYATRFLIAGGNVLLLKQNLGHTTLAMVDRYVHLATSKVAVLSQSYSPLDRLSIPGMCRSREPGEWSRGKGPKVFQRH